MGTLLRIVAGGRSASRIKETIIGFCHEFKPIVKKESCKCPEIIKPNPTEILKLKYAGLDTCKRKH